MTRVARVALTLCASLLALACRPAERRASPTPAAGPQKALLADIIANPKQYQGQRVRVVGFCHLEFEDNALYIQGTDFFHGVRKHGVWLDVEDSRERHLLSNTYVIVEGTFDAEQLGHLSLWAGTLTDVTRMEETNEH